MGSSLNPTMGHFAHNVVKANFNNTPIFYQRYVDDVLAVFKDKEDSIPFLKHMSSLNENLQFTIEHSVNNKITFLDKQLGNKTIKTFWHIKNTNTGIYLQKSAFSPTIESWSTLPVSSKSVTIFLRPKPKPKTPLNLSYDHRAINGADAARFCNTLKSLIETPKLMLI